MDKDIKIIEEAIKNKTRIRLIAESPEDNESYTFIFTPMSLRRGYVAGVNIDGRYTEIHWDFWKSVETFPMGSI